MKKIIYRKIGEDCIKFFLLTIFTISIIIWVLQAVNYLDFIIEDGHGFLVYFKYTLLSFPKIFSRIFPFAIILSFSYIFLKYENKNELVIFWNFGIKKITFVNFFIKFSLIFVLLNLLLNAVIVPLSQDKARSFLRTSDLDFFGNILKPKTFIDIINNLTIYFDEKTETGDLKNIFLKDNSNTKDYQITFAKIGRLELRGDNKILVLYNGKTINNKNQKISEFEFSKTDFNITKFGSKAETKKTQETSTRDLLLCLKIARSEVKLKRYNQEMHEKKLTSNCSLKNLENVFEEMYIRIVKPFYTTFLITVALLLILKSKDDHTFRAYKYKIYLFGFLFIVFLESSSKLINANFVQNFFIFTLPFVLSVFIYIYFITKLKTN